MRKHPRYSRLSLKNLPKATREQLIYLVDERSYKTIKGAIVTAIGALYRLESTKTKGADDETDKSCYELSVSGTSTRRGSLPASHTRGET